MMLVTSVVNADESTMQGSRRPSVRVVVTVDALESGVGHGFLEGSGDAVSLATIARIACDTGTIGTMFLTDGSHLNLGHSQRLFSKDQRIMLGTKWGGCAHPECDRAPIDCEAHHIDEWVRDSGKTDIHQGITLCRRHHKLLHDNNQRVIRDGNEYWLVRRAAEPGHADFTGETTGTTDQTPQHDGVTVGNGATVPAKRVRLRSKNPLINTMMRENTKKAARQVDKAARQVEKTTHRETALSRT